MTEKNEKGQKKFIKSEDEQFKVNTINQSLGKYPSNRLQASDTN